MTGTDPEHPPAPPDDVIVHEAAAAVLAGAIRCANPWTAAQLLDHGSDLYRLLGTVRGVRPHGVLSPQGSDDEEGNSL